jgi:hypothetical protein
MGSTGTDKPSLVVRSLAWTAAVIAAALLGGCGGGQGSGTIGQPIAAGDYQLTAAQPINPAEPPDRFTNPKPGNRFVKVDVNIENLGQLHLPISPAHFTLRDSGGIDNPARSDIASDQWRRQPSIAPGQRFQGSLYFEMAANQRPDHLVFAPQVVGWRTLIDVILPA